MSRLKFKLAPDREPRACAHERCRLVPAALLGGNRNDTLAVATRALFRTRCLGVADGAQTFACRAVDKFCVLHARLRFLE